MTESLVYNSARPHIRISEYGRIVQQMVEHAMTLEDKEARSLAVEQIIRSVGILQPQLRENQEQKRKLWDHLHAISGYTLDVDGPFPTPTPADVMQAPAHLTYQKGRMQQRHYGRLIETLLAKSIELPEGEERDALSRYAAGFMRMSYKTWSKSTISDERIAQDLKEMSGFTLELDPEAIVDLEQSGGNRQRGAAYNQQAQGGGKKGHWRDYKKRNRGGRF